MHLSFLVFELLLQKSQLFLHRTQSVTVLVWSILYQMRVQITPSLIIDCGQSEFGVVCALKFRHPRTGPPLAKVQHCIEPRL